MSKSKQGSKPKSTFRGIEVNNILETLEAADSKFVKEIRAKLALPSEISAWEKDEHYHISYLKLSIWEKGGEKWVKVHEVHGPGYRSMWADVMGAERTIFRWADVVRAIEADVVSMVADTAIREEALVEFILLVRALRAIHVDESLREIERRREESVGGQVMADAFKEAEAKAGGEEIPSAEASASATESQAA